VTAPTPYWTDGQIYLYCGDFRELLPGVLAEHGTPDLVLVDPPYSETSLTWDRWPHGWPGLMPGRSMWCFGSIRPDFGYGRPGTAAANADLVAELTAQGLTPSEIVAKTGLSRSSVFRLRGKRAS
jgi:hypothetical protein